MRNIICVLLIKLITSSIGLSQDTLEYYNRGVINYQNGDLDKAIEYFSLSIKNHPAHPIIHYAYYNRGLAKLDKREYEDAIQDLDKAVELKKDYLLAINLRGVAKKNKGDMQSAIDDYSLALSIDPNYADALENRAKAYYSTGKEDLSCQDLKRAGELGREMALKVYNSACLKKGEPKMGEIKNLTIIANNREYGFSEKDPVKVGSLVQSGPESQRAYFELLRDPQGKKIKYKRLGSCCHYETPNGFMGMGALDIYEITYSDNNGKKKTEKVYITFYDYEQPMILFGFTANKK